MATKVKGKYIGDNAQEQMRLEKRRFEIKRKRRRAIKYIKGQTTLDTE